MPPAAKKQYNNLSIRALQLPLGFLALGLFVYLLVKAKTIILPLFMAVGIWYLINAIAKPIMNVKIGGKSLPGFVCYAASIALLLFGIYMIAGLVSRNIDNVVKRAPHYQQNLEIMFEKTVEKLHIDNPLSFKDMAGYFDVGRLLRDLAGTFTGLAGKAFVVFVYVAFLLYEQRTFDRKIAGIASSRAQEKRIRAILRSIDSKIRTYLGVKTFVSALTGVISFGIMKWVGVDFADFWGLIIFFLNFIPMLGSIVAVIFPALLTLVQFDTLGPFLTIAIGLTATQIAIGNFLDPRMMGQSLNLSPIVILTSLATWGTIWGIPGMFLSIPIMVIVTITLSQFRATRPIAILLSEKGQLSKLDGDED